MSMSPRERMLTALRHEPPDRIPFSWGFCMTPEMARIMEAHCRERGLDWDLLREAVNDKVSVGPTYTGPQPAGGDESVGIWGIRTMDVAYEGGTYGEFTDFPLAGIEDPAVLDDYPWPDPADYDYTTLPGEILRADPARRKATQFFAANPFETYCWMTGLEEAMVNLLVNPEVVHRALEHITAFCVERLRRTLTAAQGSIDIVFLADDLGGQSGLLISREAYRDLLQPIHRALADCVRRLAPGAVVMLHTDGAVFDIIPDLLDAGVQVLEAVQTDAAGMDPARLKAAYGDRLSFHGAISVQHLLPHHDAATVEQECRRLVEVLGDGGGYIAAPSHAIQVGTPAENVFAMLRGVLGERDYDAGRAAAADRPLPSR